MCIPTISTEVSESCLEGFREKAEFSQDYRVILHDGTLKHLHVVWHPVLDKAGELVEYVGTAADVTESKQSRTEIPWAAGIGARCGRGRES